MPDCLGTTGANKRVLPTSDTIPKATPCVAGRSGKCCFMLLALAPENTMVNSGSAGRLPACALHVHKGSQEHRAAGKPNVFSKGLTSGPLPTLASHFRVWVWISFPSCCCRSLQQEPAASEVQGLWLCQLCKQGECPVHSHSDRPHHMFLLNI